jgi:acid phosphatase
LVLAAIALPVVTFILPAPAQELSGVPNFDHIIVIMMENHSIGQITGNPDARYLNGLAADYPVAENYFGITHPSLPNYMTLTGGDTFFTTNCSITAGGCTTPALNIVDRIEGSARTWKAYMEDMPSPCFVGNHYPVFGFAPAYMEKHNPFIHYENILDDPARCRNIVSYTDIEADLAALPNYVWITPNMCNDMHDRCSIIDSQVKTGDDWLSVEVPRIENSPSCSGVQTCLIVITFDEGASSLEPPEDNHVFTIFIKPDVRPPDSNTRYDHYSLLRTAWGLLPLTDNDSAAIPMADMF